MTDRYIKEDDVTIVRHRKLSTPSSSYYAEMHICEIFNFRARQVITSTEKLAQTTSSRVASSGGTVIQNFRDIEGADDIIAAHAELVRQGGKPPALEDVLKGRPQHHTKLMLGDGAGG